MMPDQNERSHIPLYHKTKDSQYNFNKGAEKKDSIVHRHGKQQHRPSRFGRTGRATRQTTTATTTKQLIRLNLLFAPLSLFLFVAPNILLNSSPLPSSPSSSHHPQNGNNNNNNHRIIQNTTTTGASMSPLIYGTILSPSNLHLSTKNNSNDAIITSHLIREAISVGYHHIATGSHNHMSFDETSVGQGWITSVTRSYGHLHRRDLFLQTTYVPMNSHDYKAMEEEEEEKENQEESIQTHVQRSIRKSLQNLRTDYIDAVIFHYHEGQRQPFYMMMDAWRILEEFVDLGIIRYLGIANCLSATTDDEGFVYFKKLMERSRIKPKIIQVRHHVLSLNVQSYLKNSGVVVQVYGMVKKAQKRRYIKSLAKSKGVTTAMVSYKVALAMMGWSVVIHSEQKEHMERNYRDVLMVTNKDDMGEEEREGVAKAMGWDYEPRSQGRNNSFRLVAEKEMIEKLKHLELE